MGLLNIIRRMHSRRMIGWAVSNHMKCDLAIRVLKMAIALRSPAAGLLLPQRSRQPLPFA
jgi:hypothetical protein